VTSVKKKLYICNSPFSNKVYINRKDTSRFVWNQSREFKDVFGVYFDKRVEDKVSKVIRQLKTLGYK